MNGAFIKIYLFDDMNILTRRTHKERSDLLLNIYKQKP